MKNTQLLEILNNLGLTEHESKVYFAALSLGPSTILKIAKSAEIKRTTVYSVVESLKQKGLMNIEVKGFKKKFAAENPEKLESILETRRNRLKSLLPEFSALYNLKGGESFIKYYEGLEGVKQVYNDILRDAKPHDYYLIISNMKPWYDLDREYFDNFLKRRAKLNLDVRALFQDSEVARKLQRNQAIYKVKPKILPSDTSLITNLVITPQKVVIHQLVPPILAIVIENKSVIQMHKQIFEIIWKSISE